MARVSKNPEVRRQELIDIAMRLFVEKGYSNVSVRDILKEVNGAPGMFYHYFKSKEELYNITVEQFRNKVLQDRVNIINDKSKSIIQRFRSLLKIIERDIRVFYVKFHNSESASHERELLTQMINEFSKTVSQLINEAIDENIVPESEIINKDLSYEVSLYLLHGCYGLVQKISEKSDEQELDKVFMLAMKFILNFLNVSSENIKKLLEEK